MYCVLDANVPVLRLWFDGETDTKTDYRLTRDAMRSLQRLLRRQQDHGWGSELEVLVYTYWLAHGLSYRVVSRVFNVPKPTIFRIVHRVADGIFYNLKKAISFPENLAAVGQKFVALSGTPAFHNVVGAIDGCHIRVKPPAQHRLDYLNYKGFYSINMQAICDAEGRFLDIFVGYPGSVHDTRVMKNSPFYLTARYPPPGFFIFGDGGYTCLETPIPLLTPYKEPVRGPIQQCFNYRHAKARTVIERAFGIMKTRWRSTLFRALEVAPAFATKVICTCAFLHNVCLDNGDTLEPDEDMLDDNVDPEPPHDPEPEASGNALRDALAARVYGAVV
ncbi:putative nuclease HARBI1 [Engraulis encrasicolus]|uniref:putative nuclease HARBI1 n=1 Tax=Engraulis encrasicolus TaxID=184585 RepID=UPI002FD56CFF